MWILSKQVCARVTSISLRFPQLLSTFQCKKIKNELHTSCSRLQSARPFVSRLMRGNWRGSCFASVISRHSSYKSSFKSKLAYEVDANVNKNVLIFSHKNSRFYKLLTVFGAVQFLFWTYLSLFSFKILKDMPKEEEDKKLGIQRVEGDKWYKNISFGEGKYKNGIGILCFSVGYVVLFISWMYPLRSVHKLWLLKGGQTVKIMTYAWFGRTRSFAVPVEKITCLQSRTGPASQIPMKVKGRWFFFLMDKKGTFHNTKLFDYTVGLMRNLK